MNEPDVPSDGAGSSCCGAGPMDCAFSKALLARTGDCSLAQRVSRGERVVIDCSAPVALTNCRTLMGLLHAHMRFALKLPPPSRPLLHQQALRLQCGTVVSLQDHLGVTHADVHALVGAAQARHGSLTELPWSELLPALSAWEPRRRRPLPR